MTQNLIKNLQNDISNIKWYAQKIKEHMKSGIEQKPIENDNDYERAINILACTNIISEMCQCIKENIEEAT